MSADTNQPGLGDLDAFVGVWSISASFTSPGQPPPRGEASFEWLEGRRFLIQRWQVDHPAAPDGIAIIGVDNESGACRQHYFDSRGEARIYEMSFAGGVWKLWRMHPGFCQRFTGTFDETGDTISGSWELSKDGSTWEHDFDLTYISAVAVSGAPDLRSQAEAIIDANGYMTLATADEHGLPWASAVWFASADHREFLWMSSPEARHSRNISVRSEIAIAIFDSRQPPGTGQGVYVAATAAEVPASELDDAIATYSQLSQARGAAASTRSDVEPPARHRLYRAAARERFVLSSKDERLPIDA